MKCDILLMSSELESSLSHPMAHGGKLSGTVTQQSKAAKTQEQGALTKKVDPKFPHCHWASSFDAPQEESASLTEHICLCLAPTLAILGLNTPSAFEKTASTTSAAGMEAYFFLRSRLPMEKKEPAPCAGSNALFFIFLSRSWTSSSSSFWMTSLACSRMVCSQRLTFIKVWEGVLNKLRIIYKQTYFSSQLYHYRVCPPGKLLQFTQAHCNGNTVTLWLVVAGTSNIV